MNLDSLLAKNSDFVLNLPQIKEASLLSAPTTSALMMLALGDSIIIALHETKNFSKDDYFNFHPGGKIGANLIKVKTLMRSGNLIPKVKTTDHFTDLIIVMTQKSLGCAAVIDDKNKLVGFITDGDLRRNIKRDLSKLHSVDIMNHSPLSIPPDTLVSEALFLMNESSITAIPITNQDKTLLGIIHIHDILKT